MGIFERLFGPRSPAYPAEHRKEVEALLGELVQIGRGQDFLSERPGGEFNAHCHNIRARAIGRRLDLIGGMPLMQFAQNLIRRKLGATMATHLEYAWDEIGKWIA